jgi:hypothetical protein
VYNVDIQNITKERARFLKMEEVWQVRLRERHRQKNVLRTYEENRMENERYSEESVASKSIEGGHGGMHRSGK